MSERLLQIDATNFKWKTEEEDEEDLIELRLRNEEHIQFHYSKLVKKSKYVRDKYKYSEAKNCIQQDIKELEEEYGISDESLKLFSQLIEEEKVSIRLEIYRDIYTLCKYFEANKYIKILEKIGEKELFSDLEFSIEILRTSIGAKSDNETEIASKIENYLSLHVNECIKKERFGELPISTIFRIIEKSSIEKVDMTSLVDFIIESAATRFTLFKFVLLHKVESAKLDELINFIDEQSEEAREMYTGFIGSNFSFIKEVKQKNYELLSSLKCTKEELERMREELERMKEEFERKREELKQANEKLIEKKNEEKRYSRTIIVGGYDENNVIGEKLNNKGVAYNDRVISPPLVMSLDSSSLLSYSFYQRQSVLVTRGGSLLGIGSSGLISNSLPKTKISQFTEFSIKDDSGRKLAPISAVCSLSGTLYMFSKSNGVGRQLVYCGSIYGMSPHMYQLLTGRNCSINNDDPVFLNIGDEEPVSLFGGCDYTAAISDKGKVIFINIDAIKDSPKSLIPAASLPDGEKASSIACFRGSVIVLSSNGRVFSSSIERESSVLKFSQVSELDGYEIVWLSGTLGHCLAVSKEGHVFGFGSNSWGALGLSKEINSVSSFTEISSLLGYEIRAAYAGGSYSLFETREGKILSCGNNQHGELLLSSGPSKEIVYSPRETTITGGATFCILGFQISIVFVGGYPPPNTPNMPITASSMTI